MEEINPDIYTDLILKSDLETVKSLCGTSRKMYRLCNDKRWLGIAAFVLKLTPEQVYDIFSYKPIGTLNAVYFKWLQLWSDGDLMEAFKQGLLPIVKLLYYLGVNDFTNKGEKDAAFVMAARKGHLNIMQWLYDLGGVDIHAYDDRAFIDAVINGYLAMAIWLHNLEGFDYNVQDDSYIFRTAAQNGHLSMVEWLYNTYDIDINYFNSEAFRLAAENGHLDVVEWLYNDDVTSTAVYYAFINAVKNGHLDVAKWIYEQVGVDIHTHADEPFIEAATYGHLQIAQWLYSLGADIHAHDNAAFSMAAVFKRWDVAKWLYNLGVTVPVRESIIRKILDA